MADSFDAARVVTSTSGATIADGLAVRVAIPYAVARIQPVVIEVVRVSECEMAHGIGRLAEMVYASRPRPPPRSPDSTTSRPGGADRARDHRP